MLPGWVEEEGTWGRAVGGGADLRKMTRRWLKRAFSKSTCAVTGTNTAILHGASAHARRTSPSFPAQLQGFDPLSERRSPRPAAASDRPPAPPLRSAYSADVA